MFFQRLKNDNGANSSVSTIEYGRLVVFSFHSLISVVISVVITNVYDIVAHGGN